MLLLYEHSFKAASKLQMMHYVLEDLEAFDKPLS